MSLTFDFTEIENYEEVTHEWQGWVITRHGDFESWPEDRRRGEGDEREVYCRSALTEALIFNSMSIGIGRITADNAAEVFARTKIIESLHGALVIYGDPDKTFTLEPEHIQQFIGLKINVSYETREEWVQRMFVGDGDELDKYGLKLTPMDEDEKFAWDKRPDVSMTTRFAREYRSTIRKQEKETA